MQGLPIEALINLGSGTFFTTKEAVKRDIELSLPSALERKIPYIVGSSGIASGDINDTDTYITQQQAPLEYIQIP